MTRKNRTLIAFFILILLLNCPGSVFAGDPISKLSRGIVNIGTSPLGYLNQYFRSAAVRDPFVAVFEGLFNGTAEMLERIVVGSYEVLTFPVPVPDNYEPIIRPETPLQAILQRNK
jgi:putative exosortase-associated protein (TIGR04073 family)